ncbi:MAG TPA: anti-sigma factor [Pyrinomonadaceae bacterium]
MHRHEDYKERLAAHALDALETAEARELEVHLATCAECRAELDGWQETASALAFAAETHEPDASLRSSILERARTLAQPEAARESLETITNESSNIIPFNAQPRRAWASMQTFGAIAASLIIAALAVALALLWQRNNRMEAEVARLSRDYNQSQIELAQAREDRKLLTAPGASMAVLNGTENAAGARAHLAYDKTTGRAMLVADGLPPAPEGKAYQLWFIADGKPLPGGVFNTDAAGHGEMREQIPPDGRAAAVFAVTLERAGGVPAPEGKAYLQSKAAS